MLYAKAVHIRVLFAILLFSFLSTPGFSAEYVKAKLAGKPDITKLGCQKGDFWDPRGAGECWSCPDGSNRTVFPVTSDKACVTPADELLTKATQKADHTTTCPEGTFYDPRQGGECYICPDGKKRSAYAITDDKACYQTIGKKGKTAQYSYNTGSLLKACKKGTFANVGSTKCYQCDSGWKHDPSKKVGTSGVCYQPAYDQYAKAIKVASLSGLSCPKGQFFDPVDGGSCWSCPSQANRTAYPVTSDRACSVPVTEKFSSARFKKSANATSLGCDYLGKDKFFDPVDGGTCWDCPRSNPVRTLYGVTDEKACATASCGRKNGRPCYVWERFPSCDKGLLEDPIKNECVTPDQLLCGSFVATVAKLKELNESANRMQNEARDAALDAIPGARNVIRFVQNQNDQMQKEAAKIVNKIDYTAYTKNLEEAIDQNREAVDKVVAIAKIVRDKKNQVANILLNPNLICSGNGQGVDAQLKKLGIAQILASNNPGWLDYLSPVSSAYASEATHMMTFAINVALPPYKQGPLQISPSVGIQYSTDFSNENNLAFSHGLSLGQADKQEFTLDVGGVGYEVGWAFNNGRDTLGSENYSWAFGSTLFDILSIGFDGSGFNGLSLSVGGSESLELFPKENKLSLTAPKPTDFALPLTLNYGGTLKIWSD